MYNKANQLTTATVSGTASTYVYDAFGQRLKSTVGAGTPVIQQYGMGGLLLSETRGSAETNYVYLNGMPIAAISYVHTNHLGTPQKATNSGQSVVWSGAYQPFGAVTPTTSITQNLRFPGQYADPTGFNYNMFRNYNPALGRYLESDPIGLAGGINTYVYGLNNPYKYADPDGLNPFLACALNAPCRAGATFVGKQALSAGVKYYNSVKGAPVPATLNNDANDTNTGSPEATQAQEQSVTPAPTPPEDPNCKDGECGEDNASNPYSSNPKSNPDNYRRIKGTGADVNKNDGSVWEKDHSQHGGSEWKRWENQKAWERGDKPVGVRPDGSVR